MRINWSLASSAWGAALLFAMAMPLLVSGYYGLGVASQALIFILLVQGFNFTQGLTGRISLGHIGFWAIGAYATGLVTTKLGGGSLLAMVVGVVASCVAALVLARLTNGLDSHYLALATLGFGEIVQILANNWVVVSGGSNGVTNIPPLGIGPLVLHTPTHLYYFLVAAVVVGCWFTHRFIASKPGREALSLRQSPVAAESLGIRTSRVKTVTLMISATFASVAGSLYAHTYGYISPDAFSFAAMLTVLAMLVLGGPGSVAGPVIGALLLTYVPEWSRVGSQYWQLIYGLLLFVMVLWAPRGIVGLPRQIRSWSARVRPSVQPERPSREEERMLR
jgi:ABC-type branched-chain amino acid transport system, permease component